MTSSILAALVSEEEAHRTIELPFEPLVFALIALGALMALLGVLFMFRNTMPLDPVDEAEHARSVHRGHAPAGGQFH